MPTYDYRCEACDHTFENYQSIKSKPLRKCPECKAMRVVRLIGMGGGIIFKGSGFYETDYRSEAYKKAAKADAQGDGSSKKSEAKSSGKDKTSAPTKDATKSESSKPKSKPKDK